MTVYLTLRSGASGPAFVGENDGDTLLWSVAQGKFYVGPGGGGAGVVSFNGRTGVVVPADGDYDSDQVDNVSTVTGASVSDALEHLQTEIDAIAAPVPLSNVLYVDRGSTAPGTPDGSIGHPFLSIADGCAAAQPLLTAGTQVVLQVTPGNYSGDAVPDLDVDNASFSIVGMQGTTWEATDNSRPDPVAVVVGGWAFGAVEGYFQASGVQFQQGLSYIGGGLMLEGCTSLFGSMQASGFDCLNCTFHEYVWFTGDTQTCRFVACSFFRNNNVGFSTQSANAPVYFEDCRFGTGISLECTDSDPCEISMDESSYANWLASGGALINCTIFIRRSKGYSFRLTEFPSSAGANDTNWQDVVPSAAQFGAVFGSGFTLDDATGEVTYTGAPRDFMVQAACSIFRADPLQARAAISLNNDVTIGSTTEYDHEAVCVTDSSTGGKSFVNPSRAVHLETGDKLKVVLRNGNATGSTGLQFHTLVFSAQPLT